MGKCFKQFRHANARRAVRPVCVCTDDCSDSGNSVFDR